MRVPSGEKVASRAQPASLEIMRSGDPSRDTRYTSGWSAVAMAVNKICRPSGLHSATSPRDPISLYRLWVTIRPFDPSRSTTHSPASEPTRSRLPSDAQVGSQALPSKSPITFGPADPSAATTYATLVTAPSGDPENATASLSGDQLTWLIRKMPRATTTGFEPSAAATTASCVVSCSSGTVGSHWRYTRCVPSGEYRGSVWAPSPNVSCRT